MDTYLQNKVVVHITCFVTMCADCLTLSINDSKDSFFVIFLCRASETKDDKDQNKPSTKSRDFGQDNHVKERSYGDEEEEDDDDDDDDDDGEKKQRGFFNIFRKR